ncbi:uncharacterized protein, partial [Amphiura filiformis]|uniref:uncharacterized protein n=1 Tax=Amphiura filiformis TaxID=82378 RepID=UPI003B220A3C
MKWQLARDGRSDKYLWSCRRRVGGKQVSKEISIREGSIFEDSNLTIAEVIQFIYWWCCGLTQTQIKMQMGLNPTTTCSWHYKCRDICEYLVMEKPEKIGGPGKVVQIDESKIGKRKYNKGHLVEGQWVFGGIEEDGRGAFLVCVEERSQAVLLPIIQKWILPGTHIISDGWKAYC